ncbi:MAG: aminoacyl-tRNA hydrolase [Erysipelothrix sp.]|nr:aminoacyl-tRNA hydrolase [Erysipelothrix sp.]
MKVVIGLGNPGKQYENTRHNVGFLTIDKVAQRLNTTITTRKFKALIGETFVNMEKVILVKPLTYMNLSGESVQEILKYYNLTAKDMIVITDDLDLELGKIRLRDKGSSGGQRGIQNIIDRLGTREFLRLKIGIGNNKMIETVDYVLGKIDKSTPIDRASDCIIDYLDGMKLLDLMNKYN